ncbi:hypothetical protein C1646_771768, partial [Rhizophagus diaphanus]
MNIPSPNETESSNNAPLLNYDETDFKTAKKTSWVWTYWDEETQEIKGVSRQVIICKVIDASNQTPCRKIYMKSSGSTSNAINHLRNKHDITKDAYVRYPHTSQHILETLEKVLKEWKIRELLVVGKGMKSAEVLIARAKCLIDFFLRPKQSERLKDIQKKFPDLNNDLRKENINPEKTSEYLLHVISDSPTRWNSS